jgi:hypothetical protein
VEEELEVEVVGGGHGENPSFLLSLSDCLFNFLGFAFPSSSRFGRRGKKGKPDKASHTAPLLSCELLFSLSSFLPIFASFSFVIFGLLSYFATISF